MRPVGEIVLPETKTETQWIAGRQVQKMPARCRRGGKMMPCLYVDSNTARGAIVR
jgi:hypothetical protein